MSKLSLTLKARANIPEHIRNQYPLFCKFVDYYHDWLEANQIDIASVTDLDTTSDQFIDDFKKELDPTLAKFEYINEKFLIRHLRNIYLSKGTEASFRMLFKMLYNKDIIIKYPGNMMMKPSDGKWEQLYSIFVQTVSGDALTLNDRIVQVNNKGTDRMIRLTVNEVKLRREGSQLAAIELSEGGHGYTASNTKVVIYGGGGSGAVAHVEIKAPIGSYDANAASGAIDTAALDSNALGVKSVPYTATVGGIISRIVIDNPGSGYTSPPTIRIESTSGEGAIVSNVKMFETPTIYEMNIDKNYYGTLNVGDKVIFGNYKGIILPTINSYQITNSGKNFRLGQTFDIETYYGTGATIKVTKLTANNGIAELKFIKFGYGYVSDFETHNIIPPNLSTSAKATVWDRMSGTVYDYVWAEKSGGYVLSETYTQADSNGLYSEDYVGDLNREFYSYNKYRGDIANAASIYFSAGAVCKYPGHYINSDGMASDEIKIQDSRFYQKYSYVIQADETLETYRDAVMQYVHPAGTALFGEYNMRNAFDIGLSLTSAIAVASIKHADAIQMLDGYVFNLSTIINDDSNTLYSTDLDWTANTDNKYYDLSKIVYGDVWDGSADFTSSIVSKFLTVDYSITSDQQLEFYYAKSLLDVTDINLDYSRSPSDPTPDNIRMSLDGNGIIVSDYSTITDSDATPVAYVDWVANTVYAVDDIVKTVSGYYKVVSGGDAGTTAPAHTTGIQIYYQCAFVFMSSGINNVVPMVKNWVFGAWNDTTTPYDSGIVQLNLFADPLAQFVSPGYYVSAPDQTF